MDIPPGIIADVTLISMKTPIANMRPAEPLASIRVYSRFVVRFQPLWFCVGKNPVFDA